MAQPPHIVPVDDVLLVPSYRIPEPDRQWYAAAGIRGDASPCGMHKADIPAGGARWDAQVVWSLHRKGGGVELIHGPTRRAMTFIAPQHEIALVEKCEVPETLWTLGPCHRYARMGFAIRPSLDANQNLNVLDGHADEHGLMVHRRVGVWTWCGGHENEVWTILRADNGKIATRLDEWGWPIYE